MKLSALFLLIVVCLSFAGCGGDGGNELPPSVNLPNKPFGLCFGPFPDGLNPDNGDVQTVEEVSKLLDIVKPYTSVIRTYTCAPLKDSTESIPSLAKKKGFTVYGGAWINNNSTTNDREVGYLIAEYKKGNVDLAIVGSEVMLRGDLQASALITYIRQVKAVGAPVTFDDVFNAVNSNPTIVAECDKIMINIYPYWSGVNIESAFTDFLGDYNSVKAKYPGKEIIIGETGWPSGGNNVGQAVPNPANALTYLDKILNWSNAKGIKCVYFEFINEPWKEAKEGPQGRHWGICTEDGVLKPGVLDIFKKTPVYIEPPIIPSISIANASFVEGNAANVVKIPVTLSEITTTTVTVGYQAQSVTTNDADFVLTPGTLTFSPGQTSKDISLTINGDSIVEPNETLKIVLYNPVNATITKVDADITITNDDHPVSLTIDSCPAIGSGENITGHCYGVTSSDYKIVVYIKVNGGWWIKPYFNSPLTTINADGSWSCDVTTGGIDSTATEIAIYQVVAGYDPPTDPGELDQSKIFLRTTIDRNVMPAFPLVITK